MKLSIFLLFVCFGLLHGQQVDSSSLEYQTDPDALVSARSVPTRSSNSNNRLSSSSSSNEQTMALYPNTFDASWYSASLLPTMMQYVVVPAVQAHSVAWINENTRSAVETSRQWATLFQQWARRFADFLTRLSEMRFEQCSRKFMCSLGRASARNARSEKRSAGARILEILNNLFSLPMMEGRMSRIYLEARQLGAMGGDCESFLGKEQCPVHSSVMESVFQQLRNLF